MRVLVTYRNNENIIEYNADDMEIKNNCLVLYEEKNPHGIADDYVVTTIPLVNINVFSVVCDLYTVRDRETGTGICTAASKKEAIDTIRKFEFDDVRNNIYVPDFYEYIKEGE